MNKEEIRKALEIIREPITVNCKDYHYFDNENYSKLLNVYENCLWFINNFEQINDVVERLEQENKELHNKINSLEDELEWYKQECDDLEMRIGLDE
jgi:predicted RNase H-like nuclease (RuvC/YqgF family)